jgi:hypothetical protein
MPRYYNHEFLPINSMRRGRGRISLKPHPRTSKRAKPFFTEKHFALRVMDEMEGGSVTSPVSSVGFRAISQTKPGKPLAPTGN